MSPVSLNSHTPNGEASVWCWIHADTWITAAAGQCVASAFGPPLLLAQRHFDLRATSVLACTTLMIDRGASNYRIIRIGMKNSGALHIKQHIEETLLATTCRQFHCSSDSSETIMRMHNFWQKKEEEKKNDVHADFCFCANAQFCTWILHEKLLLHPNRKCVENFKRGHIMQLWSCTYKYQFYVSVTKHDIFYTNTMSCESNYYFFPFNFPSHLS